VNKNPTPRRPAYEHPARVGDGVAANDGGVPLPKQGRKMPPSDARNRGNPQLRGPPAPFRVTIHPFHGPTEGVDVTDALVTAIAFVLWKLHGGNEPVNRLEASVLLERALGS